MYTRIIITIFVWTEFDKSLIQYNYVWTGQTNNTVPLHCQTTGNLGNRSQCRKNWLIGWDCKYSFLLQFITMKLYKLGTHFKCWVLKGLSTFLFISTSNSSAFIPFEFFDKIIEWQYIRACQIVHVWAEIMCKSEHKILGRQYWNFAMIFSFFHLFFSPNIQRVYWSAHVTQPYQHFMKQNIAVHQHDTQQYTGTKHAFKPHKMAALISVNGNIVW